MTTITIDAILADIKTLDEIRKAEAAAVANPQIAERRALITTALGKYLPETCTVTFVDETQLLTNHGMTSGRAEYQADLHLVELDLPLEVDFVQDFECDTESIYGRITVGEEIFSLDYDGIVRALKLKQALAAR